MAQNYNFNQLYFEYRALVYSLALHYVQNVEDAEEITQDVFVKVYQSIHTFKNNASVKTWIYRITVNASLDLITKKKSKKRFFIFGKRETYDNRYTKVADFEYPGVALEHKEQSAILFGVINTLPENQRTAFLLSKLEGLSNPEVSQIMQLSVGAVESLLVRAKKSLKEKLAEKFEVNHRKK
ncbi:RNA polymerase sigma factor [Flavobacterium sp. RHBU_24]|uniref:RNA polymerase sigma factor n=1 Tax=Flavobacterium sp. RHBU_24 TaxID=3391185 RepID=UPI00398568CE